MTLEEIKQAIEDGKKVHWSNRSYEVIKDSVGQYLIVCRLNDYCIGLTHSDGVTMNGKPSEFFAVENLAIKAEKVAAEMENAYAGGRDDLLYEAWLKGGIHEGLLVRNAKNVEGLLKLANVMRLERVKNLHKRILLTRGAAPYPYGFQLTAVDVELDVSALHNLWRTGTAGFNVSEAKEMTAFELLANDIPVMVDMGEYEPDSDQVYALYGTDHEGKRFHLADFKYVEEAVATAKLLRDKYAQDDPAHQLDNRIEGVELERGFINRVGALPAHMITFDMV